MLKQTAVNDCLSSATAGLNEKSMDQIKKLKREHMMSNQSRASSGALSPEDVGLIVARGGRNRFSGIKPHKTQSASRISGQNRTGGGVVSLADQKYMTPLTAANQTKIDASHEQ